MEIGEKIIFENPIDSIDEKTKEIGNELGYDIFVLSKGSYFDHVDWCDFNIRPFLKEAITITMEIRK